MSTKISKPLLNTLRREISRIYKNPIYLLMSVGVMTFCFIFFLTFFKEGQPQKMPLGVVDNDNSSLSRQFIRNLDATQQANVTMHLSNYTEARQNLQKGNIYGFVVIDKHFAKEILANKRPELTFYVNDAYLIAGSLLLKDITYMSELTGGAIKRQILRAKGIGEYQIMGILQPINIDTHLIGNPWANYGIYLLNVLLPGVLQLMIMMVIVFSIGTELKYRTSKNWLEESGNSIFLALTGKLLPYTIIFSILGIIMDILLYQYMHYPMIGSIWGMFVATILYVLSYQAIGILIIGIFPILRDGVALVAFYGLLGFTFAGFTFPIEQLPYPYQVFSQLFPIRHYFKIYVNQALNGQTLEQSIVQLLSILTFVFLPMLILARLKKAAINQHYPIK